MKKEYLTEENYQRGKSKIKLIAVIILLIGLVAGGSLIYVGITKKNETDAEYSEENKQSELARLESEIDAQEDILKTRKAELEARGIEFDDFAEYDDGEAYELKIISNVLNPSFDYCGFDEYKKNDITKDYCSLKLELDDLERVDVDFQRNFNSSKSIPYFMFGAFIIIATCMIAGSIYMFSKRREIMAFSAQQVMPIAQEGAEKMAPTAGKVAKELAKGIKEGLKDVKDDENQF